MATIQKITPFLWFDSNAGEAVEFYTSVFKNSRMGKVARYGEGGPGPAGSILSIDFTLDGQHFTALNGGPLFKFNPSVSFYVVCETETETDAVWQSLLSGGTALMPLDKYPWSEKYGWVQDQFGLSWQISLGKTSDTGNQTFTPCLLFTGAQQGKAEQALRLYTSLFKDSSITGILPYTAGEPGKEGTVKHAQFSLAGQTFMAMDNPMEQAFTFNEAVSFVVNCETQGEVDYFWTKLTAQGGEESMCGWLKDKFGVSWQIVPTILPQLLSDPDPAKVQRVMSAMMHMRKIDIGKLQQAAIGNDKPVVIVEANIEAPLESVWQAWTQPEHIVRWNNASDDWHTPSAKNDLKTGGSFNYRMESKDGLYGFDFTGVYDQVDWKKRIEYTLADGRKVQVFFTEVDNSTHVMETFEAETMHSIEMQRGGWQAILDNFKKHAESLG